jgi:hypothetical protein
VSDDVTKVEVVQEYDCSGAILGRGNETWEFSSIEEPVDPTPSNSLVPQQTNCNKVDTAGEQSKFVSLLGAAMNRIVKQTSEVFSEVLGDGISSADPWRKVPHVSSARAPVGQSMVKILNQQVDQHPGLKNQQGYLQEKLFSIIR